MQYLRILPYIINTQQYIIQFHFAYLVMIFSFGNAQRNGAVAPR